MTDRQINIFEYIHDKGEAVTYDSFAQYMNKPKENENDDRETERASSKTPALEQDSARMA